MGGLYGLIDGYALEHGAGFGVFDGDAQADGLRTSVIAAFGAAVEGDDSLVADGGHGDVPAGGFPCAAVFGDFEFELLDALTFGHEFHEIDVMQCLRAVPGEGERGLLGAVVCGPIGRGVAVEEVLHVIVAIGAGGTGFASDHGGRLGEVGVEALFEELTELFHRSDGGRRECAGLVGGQIEDEGGVATNGFEVHLEEALGRRGAFAVVPEPTHVGGFGVTLAGMPVPAVDVAACAVAHAPVGFTGPALLITDPAGFTADTPHHAVGKDFVDGVAEVGHVVVDVGVAHVDGFVLAAVEAVAAVGSVKPHFKLVFAVLCGFEALAQEDVFYVFVCAVEC